MQAGRAGQETAGRQARGRHGEGKAGRQAGRERGSRKEGKCMVYKNPIGGKGAVVRKAHMHAVVGQAYR